MSVRTKISVAVITYNQEATIRQTLDGILMQKGDFDLELVIGEDCSKDSTGAICDEIANRINSKKSTGQAVRVIHNVQNLGIMANFARVIQACTGDYISNIAGDDYYSNDRALEKQWHYLKKHPEVGVIAANGYQFFLRRGEAVAGLNPVFDSERDTVRSYYFSPSHFEGACLAPVGMMYRAELLRKYIDFDEILRRKLPVEDYPIQAILSQHTHFACLPDLLVTYRVYSSSASYISYDHPRYLEYYRGLMNTRRYLNELFPDDAVAEEVLKERMFTKEFYYYVYNMRFDDAKRLVEFAPDEIKKSKIIKTAKRYTRSRLLFTAYHYYKRMSVMHSINNHI